MVVVGREGDFGLTRRYINDQGPFYRPPIDMRHDLARPVE